MANYKSRLCYTIGKNKEVPVCLFKSGSCQNYPDKCGDCICIQSKYTHYVAISQRK